METRGEQQRSEHQAPDVTSIANNETFIESQWPNNFVEITTESVNIPIMMTLENTEANQTKLAQAESAWQQIVRRLLQRGFHGTASIEVNVQDGTIQHVRHRVEQVDK
jgi:hypothetical protein